MLSAVASAAKKLVGGTTESKAESAVKAARSNLETAKERVGASETDFHETGTESSRSALKKAREAREDAQDDLARAERVLEKLVAERLAAERMADEKEFARITSELDHAGRSTEELIDRLAPAFIEAATNLTVEIRAAAEQHRIAERRHSDLAAKLGKPGRFGGGFTPHLALPFQVRHLINAAGARDALAWLGEL